MIQKEMLEKINGIISMKHKGTHDGCLHENILLSEYCLHPDYEPREIAKLVNERRGTNDYTGDRIIHVLRRMDIGNPQERSKILKSAAETAETVYRLISGEAKSFKDTETKLRNADSKYCRCILMALFTKYPALQNLPNSDDIYYRGWTRSKACLLELIDSIYDARGGRQRTEETAEAKLARLEERFRVNNEMLEDLQNEFEIQLEESKIQEITSFFSELNSEKYGYILDGLFSAKSGLDELRRQNYELPIAINGLTILIRKLIQFIRDNGINPVLRVGDSLTVKSKDIENYIYLGSPFTSDKEEKQVEVISPGWLYKAKELQFSRPTIKEIM